MVKITAVRLICPAAVAAVLSCGGPDHLHRPPSEGNTPHYSKLVHPGPDGKLVYTPDERGNTIPDFSHAGYGGGGVKLPAVPVRETVAPGQGNDSECIQAAIDRVSSRAPGKDGFRGAVLLKRGRYTLEKPLRIAAGGVVLRGEGQDEDGTVLFGKGLFKDKSYSELQNTNLIIVEGASGAVDIQRAAVRILDEYVPVGARSFRVERPEGLTVGGKVIVRRHGNLDWIRAVGMDPESQEKAEWAWEPTTHDFDRIITGVENSRITIDAPLTCSIETRWGGGEVIPYTDTGRINRVGIENLRGESDFDRSVRRSDFGNIDRSTYRGMEYYSDENHYWNFVRIDNACNVWVRDVTAFHFAGSAVLIAKGAKWATVRDCTTMEPVSFAAGGRRFTYQIQGQLCLVLRCRSDRGRHSFVLSSPTACGPNVFLDCAATRPYSSSEPHYKFAVGALYDNVRAPLTARYWKEISIGWAGANTVFWNCKGIFLVQKPPTAQNYSIGHIGMHAMFYNTRYMDYGKEDGYIESLDEHVLPRSLYLKQLEDRLGKQAVGNVGKR
ncbi:MAG: hypothetical protein ACYC9O_12245 [Candidatus Latescibacterota bacterium]